MTPNTITIPWPELDDVLQFCGCTIETPTGIEAGMIEADAALTRGFVAWLREAVTSSPHDEGKDYYIQVVQKWLSQFPQIEP